MDVLFSSLYCQIKLHQGMNADDMSDHSCPGIRSSSPRHSLRAVKGRLFTSYLVVLTLLAIVEGLAKQLET